MNEPQLDNKAKLRGWLAELRREWASLGWQRWVVIPMAAVIGCTWYIASASNLAQVFLAIGGMTLVAVPIFLLGLLGETKLGKKVGRAIDTMGAFVGAALLLLALGFVIVWLLNLLFESVPWWAAFIILLLLFK